MLLNGNELLNYIENTKKKLEKEFNKELLVYCIRNKLTENELDDILNDSVKCEAGAILTLETIKDFIKDGRFDYKENK